MSQTPTIDKDGPRRCLGCKRLFNSSGPSNRFCKLCKKSQKRLAGGLASFSPDDYPRRARRHDEG
jgi:hypothetical protein